MPREKTYNELLQAYFHHVHPLTPVVDATTLPQLYPSGDNQQHNLLLIWSICFVAANVKLKHSLVQKSNLTNANLVYLGRYLETRGLFVQKGYEGLYVFSGKGKGHSS